MQRRQPKYAILTGYEMSRKDFEEFVMSIPNLRHRVEEGSNFESYVGAYYYWKDVLKGRAPRLKRVLYDGGDKNHSAGFSRVTSCFFPIRYTPYNREQQLQDNAAYATETEKDRATLADFMFSIESRGGSLDITKLSFRWLKDTHPSRPTNY